MSGTVSNTMICLTKFDLVIGTVHCACDEHGFCLAEKAVEKSGMMPDLGPVNQIFDSPLVPSGAALFVTGVVMLLDFMRPKWVPVTAKAKDWVCRCLSLCAATPSDVLLCCFCAAACNLYAP
jgi:hypothetical protein